MTKGMYPWDPVVELKKAYGRWHELATTGGSDPNWSDGQNMHHVRRQITYRKAEIEKCCRPDEYPEEYFREVPPEVPPDFMAKAAEIRKEARELLAEYLTDGDYLYLKDRVRTLTEKERRSLNIDNVLHEVPGLRDAIERDDLVSMRRVVNAGRVYNSFARCAESVRNLPPPENVQMSLFSCLEQDGGGPGEGQEDGQAMALM